MSNPSDTKSNPAAPPRTLSHRVRYRLRQAARSVRLRDAEGPVYRAAGPGVRNIFTYTSREELAALYRLARDVPQGSSAVEIGSHLGASTCYIAAGLAERGGVLYCVDTWQNQTMPEGEQDTFAAFTANTQRLAGVIRTVRKRSQDLVEADVRTPLALAFIDGDHSYEGCLNDFEKVRGWIQPGGVLAFHDAVNPAKRNPTYPGVARVIGQALASGEWTPGGVTTSLLWIRRMTA